MTAMVKNKFFASLITALVVLSVGLTLTTCDSPFGMGDAIDWEPPVLTMLPAQPNPKHVGLGTVLSGTVTDNIGVDRVIMREASTGRQLFRATISGDRWEIVMDFGPEDNNKKLAVEIVAYDRAGNSGDQSILAITLIVDIRPPILKSIWVQRTRDNRRITYLEPHSVLKGYENVQDPNADPRGDKRAFTDKYQNGWFHIIAQVDENETSVEVVTLNIYDNDINPNKPLYSKGRISSSTANKPEWLVKEEELLDAGEAISSGYINAYKNGKRYYYRVEVIAYDRSENGSDNEIIQDQDFFCMWEKSDEPKSVLDPVVAGISSPVVVPRGQQLPIEFFDDDSIQWAYTEMLTKRQWDGDAPLNSGLGLSLNGLTSNEAKLEYLMQQFTANRIVYNWKHDPERSYSGTAGQIRIQNLVSGDPVNFVEEQVKTGEGERDYGDFVLFAIAGDKKREPHDGNGPEQTNIDRWKGSTWNIFVADENAPLIVIDTVITIPANLLPGESYDPTKHPGNDTIAAAKTGDSPEENTFPRLTDGRFFEINGYTLRENRSGNNGVLKFRMAWIPFYMPGGPDAHVASVMKALEDGSGYPSGVKYWEWTDATLTNGTPEKIGTDQIPYRKQVFRKKFDILGGSSAANIQLAGSSITLQNPLPAGSGVTEDCFVYDGKLENETKLFIIYAEDNMGHEVYRQFRILGNKSKPKMSVYDLSEGDLVGGPLNPPDIYSYISQSQTAGVIDDNVRNAYRTALNTFNEASGTYTVLKNTAISATFPLANTFQPYSLNKLLKYWVIAEESGDLAVKTITMQDRTYNAATYTNIGYYNSTDRALSYIERLPEPTQRIFYFTATDTLGNVNEVNRTVQITNTAFLNDISSVQPSGEYGIYRPADDNKITIQARFSNPVYWTSTNGSKPQINVSYTKNGATVVESLSTVTLSGKANATSSLLFEFKVKELDAGSLITLHSENIPGSYTYYLDGVLTTPVPSDVNRPLRVPLGVTITDDSREQQAFIPGYLDRNASLENWKSSDNKHLQSKRSITLDGTRPKLKTVDASTAYIALSGKAPYTAQLYYFKENETITFTIEADDDIYTSGGNKPRIQFNINQMNLATPTSRGPYYADLQTSSSTKKMVFSVRINNTNIPQNASRNVDGEITNIRLNTANGGIVDQNGNFLASIVDGSGNLITGPSDIPTPGLPTGTRVYVDQTRPDAPTITMNYTDGSSATRTGDSNLAMQTNKNFNLVVENFPSGSNNEISRTELDKQYSTGTWSAYSTPVSIGNGTYNIRARYTDRAGNLGLETSQVVTVNANFPKLISVSTTNPNGTYRSALNANPLRFILSFEEEVNITNGNNVSITLQDTTTQNGGTSINRTTLTNPVKTSATTIRFDWVFAQYAGTFEMPNGLYISAVDFTGLSDTFTNQGGRSPTPNTTTTANIFVTNSSTAAETHSCANLNGLIKVDNKRPVHNLQTSRPRTESGMTGNVTDAVMSSNSQIVLKFDEPVVKGSGTITVRPYGDYYIPPVFTNEGYIDADGSQVDGFYEVYNSSLITNTDRQTLTQSATANSGDMSNLALNARTGNSAGPYKKMTHGLKQGAGYTGNYNNTAPGADGPNPNGTNYMVPDTSTKWVLDYQYQINATTGVVNDIRNVLKKAEFRWQKIDVISSAVSMTNAASSYEVTITLDYPLQKGLQWELFYPEGTFTDNAGNPVAALAAAADATGFRFWSSGAQTPVIRVNRRSYDARAVGTSPTLNNLSAPGSRTYSAPGATTNWDSGTTVNDFNGWGIADFNTVYYRIESESPKAVIFRNRASTSTESDFRATNGGITGNYSGTVAGSNNAGPNYHNAAIDWNVKASASTRTNGTWVLPNLIRRAGGRSTSNNPAGQTYADQDLVSYTLTENGSSKVIQQDRSWVQYGWLQEGERTQWALSYQGYRSYNADATYVQLSSSGVTNQVVNGYQGRISYADLEAAKDYIVAEARIDHGNTSYTSPSATSTKGWEGVFRSVIVIRQDNILTQGMTRNSSGTVVSNANNNIPLLVEGSNVKNGMPSFPGFPVRDAEETGDNRFIKLFHHNGTTGDAQYNYRWVSTEIVSQWYFIGFWGNHQSTGEINNYLSAGYGDLTYSTDIR